jgi:molybdopterin converting factor small subunit
MQITAQLFGDLRRYINDPEKKQWVGMIPKGATVESLMTTIGFPKDKVRLVLVNDKLAHLETTLSDLDEVSFLTLLGGG